MGKKISLTDILKSRYGSEDNLPEWVEKRREICNGCEFNSANKERSELTTEQKAWVALNHGKPTCLQCKCMLSAKTKLAHAKCPIDKWLAHGEPMKSGLLKISNISTTPTIMSERQGTLWLDLGELKNGQETDVRIKIHNEKNDMTDISAKADCGCTVPNLERRGEFIYMSIRYNTKRQGHFEKAVTLSYKQNNTQFSKIIKITGKVE